MLVTYKYNAIVAEACVLQDFYDDASVKKAHLINAYLLAQFYVPLKVLSLTCNKILFMVLQILGPIPLLSFIKCLQSNGKMRMRK
jgi:hypothetical protein